MAIQHRRGRFEDFDSSKLLPGEFAVVLSGDPASVSGRSVYVCFEAGIVKRFTTYEDFENELQNATEEIQAAFTEELQSAIDNSIVATNAAEQATIAAQAATEAANKAAEAAGAYVLGDISEKTVTFTPASERTLPASGESTATLFGKITTHLADLAAAAFCNVANNLTTAVAGTSLLDAYQGKILKDQLDLLNTKIIFAEGENTLTIAAGNATSIVVPINIPSGYEVIGAVSYKMNTAKLIPVNMTVVSNGIRFDISNVDTVEKTTTIYAKALLQKK